MAKQRLFSEPPKDSEEDTRAPRELFEDLASKVFSVPKSEIDKREVAWRKAQDKKSSTSTT